MSKKTAAVLFGCLLTAWMGEAQPNSQVPMARAAAGAPAAALVSSSDVVSLRTADSAVHEIIRTLIDAKGRTVTRTNRYTELATGMNVKGADGQYTPASAEIEIDPAGGAVAQKSGHRVEFNADIVDGRGAARFTVGDKTFVSRPLGISYYDTATGKSVLISEFRSTVATLAPGDNKIVWKDCSTDFKCNLIIENQLSGMDQCLEMLECPPAPSEFGLNNDSTRLELITEFFNPPAPIKTVKSKKGNDDLVLDFGALRMTVGKAFKIGDATSAHVVKHWTKMDNRDCLIEQVSYSAIQAQLETLPRHQGASTGPKQAIKRTASLKRILPERKTASKSRSGKVRVASIKPAASGVILDYTIITADSSDYVFQGGTTYFVTNLFTLSGTTVIEGGSVIKYSTNSVAELSIDALDCRTGPYSPAIFTSMMDDSVGESITGSTGNPWTNYCGAAALTSLTPNDCSLHDVRFSHLNAILAISMDSYPSLSVSDLQCVHCSTPFIGGGMSYVIRNALFDDVGTLFAVNHDIGILGESFDGQHITIHHCTKFADDPTGVFYFTNCLFVQTTNFYAAVPGEMHTNGVVLLNDDTGVFKVVGAGNHYLADYSPYRGVGASSIDATLVSSFSNKTTYAPTVLTNTETSDVTLFPIVGRDTGPNFDIGYHYDALDYIAWVYTITNATLTISNGTAIGYYQNAGIWLQDGASIYSQGTPLAPNRFAFYLAVQEQSTTIDSSDPFPVDPSRYSGVGSPGVYRFTCFNRVPAQHNLYDFYVSNGGWVYSTLEVRDCTFTGGGGFHAETPAGMTIGITNCLFEREGMEFAKAFSTTYDFSFYNNLLHGGSCDFVRASSAWVMRDNIFYTNTIVLLSGTVTHDHNAYINTATNDFATNSGDLVLTSFAFQTGPLGSYYQPTNSVLIDAGSQYATNAGLFHYTTTTNEVVETNTVVDIGLHYIAVDSGGDPLDTDSDGTPDYLEDANGNGTVDSGETDWRSATDLGFKVLITHPQDGSNLP